MKAWTWTRYGSPAEVLTQIDAPDPVAGEGQVVLRIRAAALNAYDWRFVRAEPILVRFEAGLRRPRAGAVLGADLAGEVEAVGSGVEGVAPGDRMFGVVPLGAFAERVAADVSSLAPMPDGLSFEAAAASPMAGLTAQKAVTEVGRVSAGHRVLVNGASGGVGHFTVQVAAAEGAEVTAVCSARNAGFARSMGATHVIDYAAEDFTRRADTYDVIIDVVGNHPATALRRVVEGHGTVAIAGGGGGRVLGPLPMILGAVLLDKVSRQRLAIVHWKPATADLVRLGRRLAEGQITPSIERVHDFDDLPAALVHVATHRARGKVVLRGAT